MTIRLRAGNGLAFLMLWVLITNLGIYWGHALITGRFWRDLVPGRDQLKAGAIARDLWIHARFKGAAGREALRYNLLQKLSYLFVLAGLLPLMILTGVTMAPSGVAAFPWLIDLFHGRQTARTLHFIVAWLLVVFVLVHLFQVVITGAAMACAYSTAQDAMGDGARVKVESESEKPPCDWNVARCTRAV